MTSRLAVVAGAAAVTVLTADAAWAQRRDPEPDSVRRPYRGIFNQADPNSGQSLIFSASLFAAYDDNVLAGVASRDLNYSWLQQSGYYQGASAGLHYNFDKSNERMGFGGQASGQVSYYRRNGDSHTLPHSNAGIFFNTKLTRGLSFSAHQSVAYAPSYNLVVSDVLRDVDGGDVVDGGDIAVDQNPDLDLFGVKALRSTSSLSLTQNIGRYLYLSGSFNYRIVEFLEDSDVPDPADADPQNAADTRLRDYHSRSASARLQYSRPITRYAQLQLGYGIRVSDQRRGTGEPQAMHNIIAGVNYSRPLSLSRRTHLSFGTGSAIASRDRLDDPDANPRTVVRLIGHASLMRELGRTWTAQLGYQRGYRTRDGFDDLFLTDSLNASLGGLITRRWTFSASARWALSTADRGGDNGARGTIAGAQTQYALTSFLGIYARYVYYSYRYEDDIPLDSRVPRRLDRQGVRVGLNTSIPLIR